MHPYASNKKWWKIYRVLSSEMSQEQAEALAIRIFHVLGYKLRS